MIVLAGDIGGTKTHVGLCRVSRDGTVRAEREATFASAEYPGLVPILREFLESAESTSVRAASFGIAGPVVDDTVATTNLPWEVSGRAVAAATGLPAVRLINDLAAMAEGIPALREEDLLAVQRGEQDVGANAVLIAAGTGLGMALLPFVRGRWRILPSEGGHADYAPRNDEEVGLLRHLAARLRGRVSVERVVSGPGLAAIHEYLCARGQGSEDPELLAEIERSDPARAIAAAALAGRGRLAVRALDLFLAAYGAAAGNLALTGLALGGVYVGGGIAAKLRARIGDGVFLGAFLDKGRFRPLLERIPLRVIVNEKAGFLGAALHAARHAV